MRRASPGRACICSSRTREELFREALAHSLRNQLNAAIAALSRPEESLESRLVAACDAWSGRFVGALGSDASDLMCASTSLAGTTLADYETRFERAVTLAIADSRLAGFCSAAGFCPADLARALHATARGLKHSCVSRAEFVKGMTVAARMFCAPLNGGDFTEVSFDDQADSLWSRIDRRPGDRGHRSDRQAHRGDRMQLRHGIRDDERAGGQRRPSPGSREVPRGSPGRLREGGSHLHADCL